MIERAPADRAALPRPPADPNADGVRVIPLGGLGEIGMNLLAYEHGDEIIVVDCGTLFPDETQPGVDVVIPDFRTLLENRERVRAVVCTHGHEDHIGAVPHLLAAFGERPPPVYAPPYAAALIEHKLRETGRGRGVQVLTYDADDRIVFRRFVLQPVRVNHSMPDCFALAISTPEGVIIHSGDFRIDATPVDGSVFDADLLNALGDRGVLALLSDSTNAEVEGASVSEADVRASLEALVRDAPGRVFVTLFASSIPRMRSLIAVAEACDRRVVLMGRSMRLHVDIAVNAGFIERPTGGFLSEDDSIGMRDRDLLFLVAGSQAQPGSALTKLAATKRSDERGLRIKTGDTVVFSSRQIPGNEKAIDAVVNSLYRKGARVVLPGAGRLVHTSGHGYRDELRRMIELTRPRHFVPIHGEYRHLVNHAWLAQDAGVPEERVYVIENGRVVVFSGGDAWEDPPVHAGRVFVGNGGDDVAPRTIDARRKLNFAGVIAVGLAVDAKRGDLVGEPTVEQSGVVADDGFHDLRRELVDAVTELLAGRAPGRDFDGLRDLVRRAVQRVCRRTLDTKPVVIPTIVVV